MNQTRIIVADRHLGVRQGIAMLLDRIPHMRVVAQTSNTEEVIQQVLIHRPDVVVMDLRLPGQSSPDVCTEILHALPSTKVIIMTNLVEDPMLPPAMSAGAVGYVVKRIRGHDLVDLIEQVSNQGRLGEELSSQILL